MHQGPGDVVCDPQSLEAGPGNDCRATTTTTFTKPGNYVLQVQAIENLNSLERQCCWTNGYIGVFVTR